MASKAELAAQASEIALALGETIETAGLNHEALTALVEELTGRQTAKANENAPEDAGGRTAGDVSAKPKPPVVDGSEDDSLGGRPRPGEAPVPRFPYSVAEGKTVSGTRKGTLGAFQRIRAADLHDGEEGLARLVASGHVVQAKPEL